MIRVWALPGCRTNALSSVEKIPFPKLRAVMFKTSVPTFFTSNSRVEISLVKTVPKSSEFTLNSITGFPVMVRSTGTSMMEATGSLVSRTTTALLVPAVKSAASAVKRRSFCPPAVMVPFSGVTSNHPGLASPIALARCNLPGETILPSKAAIGSTVFNNVFLSS